MPQRRRPQSASRPTPRWPQDKVTITYSDTVPENDIRTATLRKAFGDCLGDQFDFKPYHGATLFKQGTELTAMQRGNLDMASLAIYDFYNQVPETSILGTAYLYQRLRSHAQGLTIPACSTTCGRQSRTRPRSRFWPIPISAPASSTCRGDKKIMTPADLAGVKLRMPGGEGWQFVGEALGANPTPMAFTEVYTALQTGAIDGQDNPLPADKSMKFYEVTNQIVLTDHLIANNLFSISLTKWNSLTAGAAGQGSEVRAELPEGAGRRSPSSRRANWSISSRSRA